MVDRDWQSELTQALGPTGEDARTAAQVEHRLARVEALLAADLDKLGDAVLGATASRLDARFTALVDRIDSLIGPPSDGGATSGDPAVGGPLDFASLGARTGSIPLAEIERLNRRLDDVVERLDQLSRALAS